MTNRLIVGITGASGVIYGIRLLETLTQDKSIETHLVLSPAAKATITQETDWKVSDVEGLADVVHRPGDIGASIASGSFQTMGMIVAPCSIKSLSAIAHSYDADLLTRAADVQLKEGRPVLLMVRETPLHIGHLRLDGTGGGEWRDHHATYPGVLWQPADGGRHHQRDGGTGAGTHGREECVILRVVGHERKLGHQPSVISFQLKEAPNQERRK